MVRSNRKDARAVEDAILSLGDEIYQLTKAEIGERIGRGEESIGQAMRRLEITHDGAAISRARIKHGTTGAWMYRKCRCDVCLEARAAYKRQEREKRLQSFDPSTREHGLVSTYQAGCSCLSCTEAMRAWLAERNEATRSDARHHTKEWTGVEVEHAIRDDLSIAQIARDLGRTYDAVSNVRKAVAKGNHRYLTLLGRRH